MRKTILLLVIVCLLAISVFAQQPAVATDNPQFEWTGGGYASTAEDLARWAKMIYEGRAYAADLLPQALDGVPAPMLGRETRYGLGVIIRQDGGRHVIRACWFLPRLHDRHDVFSRAEDRSRRAGQHERSTRPGQAARSCHCGSVRDRKGSQ